MRIPLRFAAGVCAAALLVSATISPIARAAGYSADATSRIEFTGVQAGAPFKGVFHQITATVDLDPAALTSAHIEVTIDMKSVDSGDKDRDGTMRGADIFDVANFPTAHYVTRSVTRTAAGFSAVGALTLHGVTKDVPIEFTFVSGAAGATLSGTAGLKRLDFGVGRGDWKNTDWVADAVKVAFSLNLKPKT
jgi:polyisoprenoid-binding protein YceI